MDALVEPGPNQLYLINGVKIIKNNGNNYEMEDGVSLGDKKNTKNIKVNLELFLILKSKKPEREGRGRELRRIIHDMIMNNGTCDDAMAKLRKGLDKAADVTPSPGEADLAEAAAQTRKAINSGVGKLKKTGNRNKIENRESRRLSEDKRLASKGQEKEGEEYRQRGEEEKVPTRPRISQKRAKNPMAEEAARKARDRREQTQSAISKFDGRKKEKKVNPIEKALQEKKRKLRRIKTVGGKRTRKKKRRKKNTRRKKRKRKKTRRKKKKRKKTRRK